MTEIRGFRGPYRFLSNFWPVSVTFGGVTYPSVEYAFVAAKTLDPAGRAAVLKCATPGDAKRLGRSLTLRAGWDARPGLEPLKVEVMRALLAVKFWPGTPLARQLLATGTAPLIEENTWGDTFWGVCNGRGENTLGRLLMEQRTHLQQQR